MIGNPSLVDRVAYARAEADQWRGYAKRFSDEQQKALLRDLAEDYERFANDLERPLLEQTDEQPMSDPPRWHFDEFGPRRIGGWIDHDGPVELTVVVNNKTAIRVVADTFREDLLKAGIGDGRRAFTFEITSYLTRRENTVDVRYDDQLLQSGRFAPPDEEARLAAVIREINPPSTTPQQSPPEIRFLQTSDPVNYREMLQLTSRTVMEYCGRHGFVYDMHLGVCRGSLPWHATFNRIVLLRRMLVSGYTGWVCYLDADAYIADLNFDVKAFLADKEQFALIVATDKPHIPDRPHWSVNAGTFFINLGSRVGQEIVWKWAAKLDVLSDALVKEAEGQEWYIDDQSLLGEVLRTTPAESVLVIRGDPNLINYSQGLFIRQLLRFQDERMTILRVQTDRVMHATLP